MQNLWFRENQMTWSLPNSDLTWFGISICFGCSTGHEHVLEDKWLMDFVRCEIFCQGLKSFLDSNILQLDSIWALKLSKLCCKEGGIFQTKTSVTTSNRLTLSNMARFARVLSPDAIWKIRRKFFQTQTPKLTSLTGITLHIVIVIILRWDDSY